MGKEKCKNCRCGWGWLPWKLLLARQDAQQPEHLAVSKGISCVLYPLGQVLKWAPLEDFYNRDCQSSPSNHTTKTRDNWQPGLGADLLHVHRFKRYS